MSTRTFEPDDPEAAPFEELRLKNMEKPKPRPESESSKKSAKTADKKEE